MVENIKIVLLSTASLPHTGVASWTTRMNYLLKKTNGIDYVIGPRSNIKIKKPIQIFIDGISFLDKVKCKIDYRNRFNPYIRGLKKVLKEEEKIVLQVKDNLGLLKSVLHFIDRNKLRDRVYIQYHYHAFPPFEDTNNLYDKIDELVLLSNASYMVFKEQCNNIPFPVAINNNGVDSSSFKPVAIQNKATLRNKYNLSNDKLIFIWCSQDRKKKGLDIIIQVWKLLLKERNDIELLVFGTTKEIDVANINVMGLAKNNELVEYYQLADFYLFPTLCQEGFGLSLVEALKCGCYCIAANNGAVPYVLNNGAYGKLIKNPNFVSEWVEEILSSIEEYLKNKRGNPYLTNIPKNLFDIHDWYIRYNSITNDAKNNFNHRYYL